MSHCVFKDYLFSRQNFLCLNHLLQKTWEHIFHRSLWMRWGDVKKCWVVPGAWWLCLEPKHCCTSDHLLPAHQLCTPAVTRKRDCHPLITKCPCTQAHIHAHTSVALPKSKNRNTQDSGACVRLVFLLPSANESRSSRHRAIDPTWVEIIRLKKLLVNTSHLNLTLSKQAKPNVTWKVNK